jgi:hypothetical protein
MSRSLDRVIDCQEKLIEAIDRRDASAIETATTELSGALSALREQGAVRDSDRAAVEHAMKQAEASRIRVNVLSDWTRQRIDRLEEIRRGTAPSYGNKGISLRQY